VTGTIEAVLGKDAIATVRRPITQEREKCINRWVGKLWTINELDAVHYEDYNLLQTQQVARLSPVTAQFLFSFYLENLVHYFQDKLIDAMM